ncbi:MAG: hypothetical protein L0Z70_10400 [Chloroflexi bacterium]|nr:hypothetical protein [Chloroflexota bacterium]
MKSAALLALAVLLLVNLACAASAVPAPIPTLSSSPYNLGRTLYGFFPSPPEATTESVIQTYQALGEHADVALLQQNIPWTDFAASPDAESQRITDIHNQFLLAHQNGLEVLFVVDPLNGLNRREFMGLPWGWEASFANPELRQAFTFFTLRIVRQFHPRYLGLASEINTYADAHPEDFPHYLSLYQEVYDLVKHESPETQVFVTFQWEDLTNMALFANEGRTPGQPNWETVEAFEPRLDLWVISSYPFVAFPSAADIPADYYTPLLARTEKPLAVAEGGYTSQPIGPISGAPQDQIAYLQAIHDQLGGERLVFWVYLLLTDLNIASYAKLMRAQGLGRDDVETLGMFAAVGLRSFDGAPKPALEVWDSFR